eukprot:2501337-Rhodomonas_salina.1
MGHASAASTALQRWASCLAVRVLSAPGKDGEPRRKLLGPEMRLDTRAGSPPPSRPASGNTCEARSVCCGMYSVQRQSTACPANKVAKVCDRIPQVFEDRLEDARFQFDVEV